MRNFSGESFPTLRLSPSHLARKLNSLVKVEVLHSRHRNATVPLRQPINRRHHLSNEYGLQARWSGACLKLHPIGLTLANELGSHQSAGSQKLCFKQMTSTNNVRSWLTCSCVLAVYSYEEINISFHLRIVVRQPLSCSSAGNRGVTYERWPGNMDFHVRTPHLALFLE